MGARSSEFISVAESMEEEEADDKAKSSSRIETCVRSRGSMW